MQTFAEIFSFDVQKKVRAERSDFPEYTLQNYHFIERFDWWCVLFLMFKIWDLL